MTGPTFDRSLEQRIRDQAARSLRFFRWYVRDRFPPRDRNRHARRYVDLAAAALPPRGARCDARRRFREAADAEVLR